jgi:hypothetical protein
MSEIKTKPIDWNALVRGKGKRHLSCGWCFSEAPYPAGTMLLRYCGETTPSGGNRIHPDERLGSEFCGVCRLGPIEDGPCSPGCKRP